MCRQIFKHIIIDHSSLSSTTAVQNELFHILHHFTPHGRYELNKLTLLPMCGFIAQLVEQRTGNAEVTGSNSVEALIFFRLLLSNCLNWKIYCNDHSSLSSTTAVQNELFHILHQIFKQFNRFSITFNGFLKAFKHLMNR